MERQCLDGCMEAAKDEKLEDVNRDKKPEGVPDLI